MRLPESKRAVVKVGSSLIAPEGHRLSVRYLLGIARFVAASRARGREIVLVSSGAVAAGRATMARGADRHTLSAKQALAALGQPRVMELWSKLVDVPCAQVLLTHDDLQNRRRFVNAKNTLRELLELGAVPIVNENDSVAVDELKVGDNDNLAAHVAVLVEADLLVILSDVDGLYDADPRSNPQARLIAEVAQVDDALLALAGGAGSATGTGGMRTKLEAARKAAERGIPTAIVNGRDDAALLALAEGELRGTLVRPTAAALSAKQHWMRHALVARGTLTVDAGAARALRERGASLLPTGIVEVDGEFRAGDAVEVVLNDAARAVTIARGITQFDAAELRRLRGRPTSEIAAVLGYSGPDTAIHRDDLVLL
jgi:glutamate 5-kinase